MCRAALARRGDYDLNPLARTRSTAAQARHRERSELQARSNEFGKKVGQAIKSGADPKGSEVAALKEEGNQIKAQIQELEPKERELKAEIEDILLNLPKPAQPHPPPKEPTKLTTLKYAAGAMSTCPKHSV